MSTAAAEIRLTAVPSSVSRSPLLAPYLVAIGLDHTTAPIELRERLAYTESELPTALANLTKPDVAPLEQAVILSTCNRVEVYGITRSRRPREELMSFVARYRGLDPRELDGAVYMYRDAAVAPSPGGNVGWTPLARARGSADSGTGAPRAQAGGHRW
jgi:hypothetical protein